MNQLVQQDNYLYNEIKEYLSAENINFVKRNNFQSAQNISGAIFKANLDRTNPINFGIENNNFIKRQLNEISMIENMNKFLNDE